MSMIEKRLLGGLKKNGCQSSSRVDSGQDSEENKRPEFSATTEGSRGSRCGPRAAKCCSVTISELDLLISTRPPNIGIQNRDKRIILAGEIIKKWDRKGASKLFLDGKRVRLKVPEFEPTLMGTAQVTNNTNDDHCYVSLPFPCHLLWNSVAIYNSVADCFYPPRNASYSLLFLMPR